MANYWCDFCKTYVTDSKLSRSQHDATSKHQRNYSNYLSGLRKKNEQEANQKQKIDSLLKKIDKDLVKRGIINDAKESKDQKAIKKEVLSYDNSTKEAESVPKRIQDKPTILSKRELEDQERSLLELGVNLPHMKKVVDAENAVAGQWETVSIKRKEGSLSEDTDNRYDDSPNKKESIIQKYEENSAARKSGTRTKTITDLEIESWDFHEKTISNDNLDLDELPPLAINIKGDTKQESITKAPQFKKRKIIKSGLVRKR